MLEARHDGLRSCWIRHVKMLDGGKVVRNGDEMRKRIEEVEVDVDVKAGGGRHGEDVRELRWLMES